MTTKEQEVQIMSLQTAIDAQKAARKALKEANAEVDKELSGFATVGKAVSFTYGKTLKLEGTIKEIYGAKAKVQVGNQVLLVSLSRLAGVEDPEDPLA
jgi:hypothetical protein